MSVIDITEQLSGYVDAFVSPPHYFLLIVGTVGEGDNINSRFIVFIITLFDPVLPGGKRGIKTIGAPSVPEGRAKACGHLEREF